jgi:hypothetical protein
MILHCVDPDPYGSYQIERKDPHQSDKLDPDPDPHKIDKLDPDPVPHKFADDKPRFQAFIWKLGSGSASK